MVQIYSQGYFRRCISMPVLRQQHIFQRNRYYGRMVRFGLISRSCAGKQGRPALSERYVSGRQRPIPRLVPILPSDIGCHQRDRSLQNRSHPWIYRRRRRQKDVQVLRKRRGSLKSDQRVRRRYPAALGYLLRLPR
ncbi:hypothetical protein SDC9_161470 [bioreactor metagenome]|uniref:Uncharacterized protein n=1 Tax=bioreactor metagenome TaxID=1076179 RepID=A0A645FPH8_9ZZZZ